MRISRCAARDSADGCLDAEGQRSSVDGWGRSWRSLSQDAPIGTGRREWIRNSTDRGHGADRASHWRGALRRCQCGGVMVVTTRRRHVSYASRSGRGVMATRRACNRLLMRLARRRAPVQHGRERRDRKRDRGCRYRLRDPGHNAIVTCQRALELLSRRQLDHGPGLVRPATPRTKKPPTAPSHPTEKAICAVRANLRMPGVIAVFLDW